MTYAIFVFSFRVAYQDKHLGAVLISPKASYHMISMKFLSCGIARQQSCLDGYQISKRLERNKHWFRTFRALEGFTIQYDIEASHGW